MLVVDDEGLDGGVVRRVLPHLWRGLCRFFGLLLGEEVACAASPYSVHNCAFAIELEMSRERGSWAKV